MHIDTASRLCTGIDDYVHTYTHVRARAQAHKNTIQTVWMKDSITQLKCSEKRNLLSLFLKERRVSDVFGEVVPDVRTETGERTKAVSYAVEALEFEYACV